LTEEEIIYEDDEPVSINTVEVKDYSSTYKVCSLTSKGLEIQMTMGGKIVNALIDTGSAISAIDSKLASSKRCQVSPSYTKLVSADCSAINTIGKTTLKVTIAKHTFVQEFVVVKHLSKLVILGMDILQTATIDIKNHLDIKGVQIPLLEEEDKTSHVSHRFP